MRRLQRADFVSRRGDPRGGIPAERRRSHGRDRDSCVGGEGGGLPTSLRPSADEHVTIPMAAPVESLNVAVAAALLVYEARRQRALGAVGRSSAGGHKCYTLP